MYVYSSSTYHLFFSIRHIIFAPSSHNKYAGESFPGIYDAMFDIENKEDPHSAWTDVKKHISIAAFTIQAAAGTLTEVLEWGPSQVASHLKCYWKSEDKTLVFDNSWCQSIL